MPFLAGLPYLLAVSFPLAVLCANPGDIPSLAVVFQTVAAVLVIVAVVDLAARLVLRRSPARELIVCEIIVYVATYGFVDQGLLRHALSHRYLLPLWSVLFLVLVAATWKYSRHPALGRVASFVQVCIAALVCIQTASLGFAVLPDLWRARNAERERLAVDGLPTEGVSKELPDIYYIVLDAYGREDILRELYDHDNRGFLEALESRGFFVASQSRSNYNMTDYSLPSSLNMTYLDQGASGSFKTVQRLHEMANDNEVVRVLKRYGYRTIAFSSGHGITECTSFDRYISGSFALNDFQTALLRMTLIDPVSFVFVSGGSGWGSARTSPCLTIYRNRILRTFGMLPEVAAESPSPAFVFAHILAPHQPFVFDADGSTVDSAGKFSRGIPFIAPAEEDRELYAKGYRQQLRFVNKKVLEVVDRILADSTRQSIIVLQGDHGPCSMRSAGGLASLRERLSILYAIRLPPDADVALHDDITPVNTFRLILDHYFNTGLGVLEDRSYVAEEENPRGFRDVTGSVAEPQVAIGKGQSLRTR